ncbi:MAG: hypothetical protein KBC84_05010, partial [Proteobacteria bacterium]|nr:hypothetical protein [Pseudomonadota bacterium]
MQKQLLRLVEDKSKPVISVPTAKKGDLWNAESGKMHSLHQICYYPYSIKPELVDFAIRKYSNKGDIVLDPFCGRGTVGLQANLLGRIAWQSDINPLAVEISTAKSLPVGLDEVVLRLNEINFNRPVELSDYNTALYTFFHPQTYRELVNLKNFVESKRDRVNTFIEVLALSRLHGHTDSFFSGYTSPQIALSPAKQLQLNLRRRAEPEYRTVPPRIIRRAAQVLQDGFSSGFFELAVNNRYQMSDAKDLSWVGNESVDLIIAQPPLLEKYNYYNNHWLSYWFSDLEIAEKQNATFLSRSVE